MIIKKISLLGIVLFSVFSQSFCMEPNVTGTSDKKWKKINVRHALAEQWKFDSSFDNDLRPALRDYTRHRCNLNIMLAGICASVALVGAVVALKTSSWSCTIRDVPLRDWHLCVLQKEYTVLSANVRIWEF